MKRPILSSEGLGDFMTNSGYEDRNVDTASALRNLSLIRW